MKQGKDKTRSLVKGSAIYSIGNIGTLAINFFLVPLYTFYLSKEDLGYFDLLASTLVLALPIFFGGIELAVIRWVLANNELSNVKKVISNCFIVFLIGLGIFTIVFVLFDYFVPLKLALYVYIYFVSNFFYIIAKQVIRSAYSSLHYVATELIYVLFILLFTLFFVRELQMKGLFIAYGIASFALLIYLLFLNITKYIRFKLVDSIAIRGLLTYSFPLVLNAMSLWVNNQSSKYLIASFLTLSANGIYAIAFKFAYVIQILNRIFYFSFQDKMYIIYGKNGYEEFFSKTFKKYTSILFSLLFLLIGSQKIILPLIIDKGFLESMNYIPILGLGVVFMSLSSILGIIYQCEMENMSAFKTSFVSGIIILVIGLIMIPYLGLIGASLAFALGNLGWLLYRHFDIQRFLPLQIQYKYYVLYISIAMGIWGITCINLFGAHYLAFIMALGAALWFNWELVVKYYTILKLNLIIFFKVKEEEN